MSRYWFPKPYADFVARLRVPGGFVLVAAFAWFSDPTMQSLLLGLPPAVLGLLLRGWAAGHLAKNRQLATSGPYAWTRNPLYLGTLLIAGGLVIAARSPALAALFAAVFALIYLPVVELEEQHLRALFPQYKAYAEHVPRFSPRRPRTPAAQRFQFALYWKNQEYQALAGFLIGVLWLAWRAV